MNDMAVRPRERAVRRWGKAGVPLTDREARARDMQVGRKRYEAGQHLERARQAWAAGLVRPYRITLALDAHALYGPGVDEACGVTEPAVDRWEAGTLYPTWGQLQALAALCGVAPGFFMAQGADERPPLRACETSLRYHAPDVEDRPFVPVFAPTRATAAPPPTCAGTFPARAAPRHTPAALVGEPEHVPPPRTASAALTGRQDAAAARDWPARETGPCARCRHACHRYGTGGAPLCPACRGAR